ncbi:MAG: ComF family protein [Gemmatimonadota bacterium]
MRAAVRAVRSGFLLEGPVREIVHALKYRGWPALGHPAARRMAALRWPRETEDEVQFVVPVPLSPLRLRQRGYNQAAAIGAEFARLKGWQLADRILYRTRAAGSQTTLHPGERRANVAGAFGVRPGLERVLSSHHVLLIDDVWTTGATALACADALLDSGVRAVSIATFARALPEFERLERRIAASGVS